MSQAMHIALCTHADSQVLSKFLRDLLEDYSPGSMNSLSELSASAPKYQLCIIEEAWLRTEGGQSIRTLLSKLESTILLIGSERRYEEYEPLIPEIIYDYIELPVRAASLLQRIEQIQATRGGRIAQGMLGAAEAQLNQFRLAIEQSPVSIVITNPEGRIEYVNKQFQELSGYDKKELIGENPRVLSSGQQPKSFYKELWKTILAGKVWRGEFHNKNKAGESYYEGAIISPIMDEDGKITHLIGVKEDLTTTKQNHDRRKALEKQIQRTQRMEAIGTLAGGIAHDFNNILQSMYLYLGMALDDLEEGDTRDDIKQAHKSALRAKDLVEQILTFSRMGESEKSEVQIQYVIKEASKFLKSSLPASVRIVEDVSTECPAVHCDPAQIHQVFLNLCSNSFDSLVDGRGEIHVQLEEITLSEEQANHKSLRSGHFVCLTISDNGIGMSESIREKIFDPFFSTKPPGKGSGLGLSVVYAIVEEMGGEIKVQSAEGAGTEIALYLPALTPRHDEIPPEFDASIDLNSVRVQIVERDLSILAGMKVLLERHGALVTAHEEPETLLGDEAFWTGEACIVLAAYDIHSMDGLTLAESIKSKRSDHVFVLMSGDDLAASISPIKLQVLDRLIRKPWESTEMVSNIAELIATHGLKEVERNQG